MKLTGIFVAAAILAANPLHLGDPSNRARYHEQDAQALHQMAKGVEPAPAPVVAGAVAPDFSYQAPDRTWRHLHDQLAQGSVMLVFGADEKQLRALESERDPMLDLGVVPVAVVDASSRVVRALEKELDLGYTLIADGRMVIAAQFNAVDPVTRRARGHWFVVDRSGRVRAVGRDGLPASGYAAIAAAGLGLPAPGVTLPSSR